MKKMWFSLTLLAPIAIFLFLFSKIGIKGVRNAFEGINVYFLLAAIVLSLTANLFFSIEKWRQILKLLGLNIPFKELFLIHTGSIPLKTISPMKSGMLLRAVYLNRNYDFSLVKGTYSLFLGIFLNLAAVLFFIVIASLSSGSGLQRSMYLGASAGLVLFPAYLAVRSGRVHNVIKGYFRLWGGKFNSAEAFFGSVTIPPRRLLLPLAYSVFLVFFELLNFKILSASLGLTIPFATVVLFASLAILIGNVPVAIHGFGTREAAICFLFSAYGTSDTLLSLGIAVSLVEYILPVLIGLFLTRSFLARLPGT